MLRKTIKFQDIDGVEQEADFYFHLTKAELVKLQISQEGGLAENLQAIGKSGNAKLILSVFEEVIRSSYGVRTPSGGFVKREEDWLEFKSSEAYSELFMELVTDGSYGAQFVAGIMPANMSSEVEQAIASMTETVELPQPDTDPNSKQEFQESEENEALRSDNFPAWYRERREPNPKELQLMERDEMLLAFKVRAQGFPPIDA